MKQLFLLITLCTFAMCSPKTAIKMGDYEELTGRVKLENYVDKKVTFVASRCKMEYQHMLKSSIDGIPSYICLDSDAVGQVLAYYKMPSDIKNADNIRFRVFGKLGTISGAGKGGGTHTEYYLDLDYVEL
ncbi:MAG: hypothetical protein AB8G11_15055 [Saprospiraceae bacterium]